MLTASHLRSMLHYDEHSGEFTWLVHAGHMVPGDPAGKDDRGYTTIRINRQRYMAHRLAFLYMTGSWPKAFVDHIDRDKGNNRWANLREATRSQNQANRPGWGKLPKGVSKSRDRYRATIEVMGRRIRTKSFGTPEEAHDEYMKIARCVHGDFASA